MIIIVLIILVLAIFLFSRYLRKRKRDAEERAAIQEYLRQYRGAMTGTDTESVPGKE